jgi:hypothetical protein
MSEAILNSIGGHLEPNFLVSRALEESSAFWSASQLKTALNPGSIFFENESCSNGECSA